MLNKDVKRLKCSAFILHVLGPVLKWWNFVDAKDSGSLLKEQVYSPYQGKEYPHRKCSYCAREKFQERDIIKAPKGWI